MVNIIRMIEKNFRHFGNVCKPQLNSANVYYLETGANSQNNLNYCCLLGSSLVVLALAEHVNVELRVRSI